MKQYLILSISFLAMFFLQPGAAKSAGHNSVTIAEKVSEDGKSPVDPASDKGTPFFPGTKQEAPHSTKAKAPHMEELPHIHRFHKERVKKIKQHHSKFWVLGKILLILCHLSILVIAYLHAIH